MTIQELINKLLECKDKERIVIFEEENGGWTNIEIKDKSDSTLSLVPSYDRLSQK